MNTQLDTLCLALMRAKEDEAAARDARVAIEERIVALVQAKDEGTSNAEGAHFKASVTFGMNRTIDKAALESLRADMPPGLFFRAIDYRPAIVLEGLRYLRNNEPDAYAQLAQAISAKPAKPSVRVEELAQERRAA